VKLNLCITNRVRRTSDCWLQDH